VLKKISLTLRIAACLLCTQAILPIQAQAQESAAPAASVSHTVSIDGAGELTSLLKDNLEISRRQSAGKLPEDEIRRLAGTAPNQIRALLATEGYFSPSVTHELDQRGETWAAHYTVALGPRTLIDTVDIRIKGDVAASNPQRVERLQRRWSLPSGNAFRQK